MEADDPLWPHPRGATEKRRKENLSVPVEGSRLHFTANSLEKEEEKRQQSGSNSEWKHGERQGLSQTF